MKLRGLLSWNVYWTYWLSLKCLPYFSGTLLGLLQNLEMGFQNAKEELMENFPRTYQVLFWKPPVVIPLMTQLGSSASGKYTLGTVKMPRMYPVSSWNILEKWAPSFKKIWFIDYVELLVLLPWLILHVNEGSFMSMKDQCQWTNLNSYLNEEERERSNNLDQCKGSDKSLCWWFTFEKNHTSFWIVPTPDCILINTTIKLKHGDLCCAPPLFLQS